MRDFISPHQRYTIKYAQHSPGVNIAAVGTIAAEADETWCAEEVIVSYDAAPTGGRLTVVVGSTTLLDVDINQAGAQRFRLHGIHHVDGNGKMVQNEALVATAAAGGDTISCTVTVIAR